MAREEVLFYRPLLDAIHIPSAAIHAESTTSVHRAEDSQGELFSDGYIAVADRGGGASLSTSASEVDFVSKKLNPKTSSTREVVRKNAGGYEQSDFDERDLRKLAEAEKELHKVIERQPGLTALDILELQCQRTGVPLKKAMRLKKLQS